MSIRSDRSAGALLALSSSSRRSAEKALCNADLQKVCIYAIICKVKLSYSQLRKIKSFDLKLLPYCLMHISALILQLDLFTGSEQN